MNTNLKKLFIDPKYANLDFKKCSKIPAKYVVDAEFRETTVYDDNKSKIPINQLQEDQAVAWIRNGDGQAEFFKRQREVYPAYIPLLHVRTLNEKWLYICLHTYFTMRIV